MGAPLVVLVGIGGFCLGMLVSLVFIVLDPRD